MNQYLKIFLKFLIFIPALIFMNFIYKTYIYEDDIQLNSPVINKVRKVVNDSCVVVYVGESSNLAFKESENDKRHISEMISSFFPSLKFGDISKEACHAGIYYTLLRTIPENSSIKTIIVTMNLRSFDADWIYSKLETPLQKSMVLLKPYPPLFNRLLLSFRGYDIKNDKEREKQVKSHWKREKLSFPYEFHVNNAYDWDAYLCNAGVKNPDGSYNQGLTELGCHYIKTYAFQIDTNNNPRIKDFDNIVLLAKKNHWDLVFNLLGENIQRAAELTDKEVVYLIKQNRDLLVKRYNKNGVIVVDNLETVNNDQYLDVNWTSEHYGEIGRNAVAKIVADSLRKIYPKEYVDISK